MVKIRIADLVQRASTYDDGQTVFYRILTPLIRGDRVELSFEGIAAVPSAFVNGALVQLLNHLPMEAIRRQLHITNSTRYINSLIKRRFDFVSRQAAQNSSGPELVGPVAC